MICNCGVIYLAAVENSFDHCLGVVVSYFSPLDDACSDTHGVPHSMWIDRLTLGLATVDFICSIICTLALYSVKRS